MANYGTLKAAIQEVIKTNGNNEITGQILQQSLLAMINSLGADYQFAGVATPTTNPGTPDQNVVYFAGPGTYPNFNNTTIPAQNLGIFAYNGSWTISTFKTSPLSVRTESDGIIQLYDGDTPVYPKTKGDAVFHDGNEAMTSAALINLVGAMTEFGVEMQFNAASSKPMLFEDGDIFFVINQGNNDATISTRETEAGGSSNNHSTVAGGATLWTISGGPYYYFRCGGATTISLLKIKKLPLVTIDTPLNGQVINTPDVGQTLNPTPISNSQYLSKIISVKKGDVVYIKGYGGNNARTYAITDTNYVVLKRGAANGTPVNYYFYITQDGYVVVNFYKTISYAFGIIGGVADLNEKIEGQKAGLEAGIATNKAAIDAINANIVEYADFKLPTTNKLVELRSDRVIIPSGSRITYKKGSSVVLSSDTELVYPSGFDSMFVVINLSTGALSIQGASVALTGKAIVFSLVGSRMRASLPLNWYGRNSNTIPADRNDINGLMKMPTDDEMFDFTDDLAGVTFDSTIMAQVYTLFDSLMAANPSYITKVDAATVAGLSYPRYANGISSGDPDYLETPSYKTYLYKLIDRNTHVHTNNVKKGSIFLVGGTHGNERAAIFNLYLIAKNLCTRTDENDFYNKLRSAYDVYILPCLNGYGILHNLRDNANGVNINRNAPVPWWAEAGAGTVDYTGPSAGSEFETQLFVALCNSITPVCVIDHHNYSFDNTQFYAVGADTSICKPAYQSMAECCRVWRKRLPYYFGTAYKLFTNADNGSLPGFVAATGLMLATWAHYYTTPCALTLEVSQNLCYIGGTYTDNAETRATSFNKDVFGVAEFTMRNGLANYINAYLDKILK